MANAVPPKVQGGITGVAAVAQAVGFYIAENVRSPDAKPGADEHDRRIGGQGTNRRNTGQTRRTGAAQKIHQYRFSLVVGVVRREDGPAALPSGDAGERAVTQLTRGFFNALTETLPLTRDMDFLNGAGQSPLARQAFDKTGIGGGITAQLVIDMPDFQ